MVSSLTRRRSWKTACTSIIGGRQTKDDKNGWLYKVNNTATNLFFDQSEERFDPVAVAALDVTQDFNVYARYSTGYRAGGASSRSLYS